MRTSVDEVEDGPSEDDDEAPITIDTEQLVQALAQQLAQQLVRVAPTAPKKGTAKSRGKLSVKKIHAGCVLMAHLNFI